MPEPLFLEIADRIGRRLCRDALWAGRECNWLGWSMEPVGFTWSTVYRAQSATLYSGTAGIALFLARLYRLTRDDMQKTVLEGAINRSIAGLESIEPPSRPSLYNGAGGIAYACLEAGEALEHDGLLRKGLRILEEVSTAAPSASALDVLDGSAGTIQLLLHAAGRSRRPPFIESAVAHGRNLLSAAHWEDGACSWTTMPIPGQKDLLGYAHGAAGIGCALAELWSATGDKTYQHAAESAFRYERRFFSSTHNNWPDFRVDPAQNGGQPVYGAAWCHGAPGIGFSRVRTVELGLQDSELVSEVNAALQSTASSLQSPAVAGAGLCLCHGHGGNAELLLEAARVFDRVDLREIAEAAGRNAAAQYHAADLPWPCGVMGAGETPNLMLGLAGIGHFYLRLYDPAATQSVLLLRSAAPKAAHVHA
jgi:lantibiotic modifying enzyme